MDLFASGDGVDDEITDLGSFFGLGKSYFFLSFFFSEFLNKQCRRI